jgi:sigma-B regulation protein RsbU (phosphoserine phosphatase)
MEETNEERLPAATSWQLAAIAVASGAVAFVLGSILESRVMAVYPASARQLEWTSDVVVAAAVVVATWLWLHLRASRMRLLQLERQQVALDEQLRLAAEIQRNLLPALPASIVGFGFSARLVQAQRIGGDFYDFVARSDRAIAILGDVSGKGIPAALLQSSLKTLFRVTARQTVDPVEIASRMSAALYDETGGLPYATCIVACFEPRPARIAWANAGHPAGLLRHDGRWIAVESGGPPLGLLPGARYEGGAAQLGPGSFGVFVTDGITEALEGVPLSLVDALSTPEARTAASTPARTCDYLVRLAGEAPGPPGVDGWQDDRTVLAFACER